MKKIFTTFLLLLFVAFQAQQVGINTTSPKATLDIKAETDGSNTVEGLLIPSLTDGQIQAMSTNATDHAGLMIFNSTKNCIQVFDANNWSCIGEGSSQGLDAYLNITYNGSTGTWVEGYPTNNNTISFKIGNNSNISFSQLNFNSALQLTNASTGLSYTSASDYSNVTISAGSYVILTYTITGTPTQSGTLTANFNSNGLTAYGNVEIQPKSGVRAMGISFVGDYVSNRELAAPDNHSVVLTIKNFSNTAVTNADLSDLLSLTGIEGPMIAPNQNTNVTIQPNQEIDLTYALSGVAKDQGTLTASLEPNLQVAGSATASQLVALFRNASANSLAIEGTYLYGQTMNPDNKITVNLVNNNPFDLIDIDLKNAITLSGAVNNINVVANQNTNVSIPANQTVTIEYALEGTSIVNGGGTLSAEFNRPPFPILNATKAVIGNNNFYATPNTTTLPDTGGTYTFEITSSEPWTASVDDAANNPWLTIDAGYTSGTGNGEIKITTTPKTSAQGPQIGYISITRPSDGVTIKITINQPPTDNFEVTGFSSQAPNAVMGNSNSVISDIYYVSIHNNKTSTLTTNQNNIQVYGDLPSFIESVNFVNNEIILTPKERLTPGLPSSETIRFSYGNGYLSPTYTLYQNQKAYQCPANSPVIANNGYRVWNSRNYFTENFFVTTIEARAGIDNFNDYTFENVYDDFYDGDFKLIKTVVQNNNQSVLIAKGIDIDNPDNLTLSFNSSDFIAWSNPINYKYVFMYKTNKVINLHLSQNFQRVYPVDLSNSVVISPVICADGYDEDTPNVTGSAGWRLIQ